MKFEGKYTISAPRSVVWATLMKDGRLSSILAPEFQLKNADNNRYEGSVRVAVGPLRGVYQGHLTLSQTTELESFRVDFMGKSEQGRLEGYGRICLEPHNKATIIHYEGEVSGNERLGALPARMVQANVNAIIRRAIESVQRVFEPEKQTVAASLPLAAPSKSMWARAALMGGLLAIGGFLLARLIGKKLSADSDT